MVEATDCLRVVVQFESKWGEHNETKAPFVLQLHLKFQETQGIFVSNGGGGGNSQVVSVDQGVISGTKFAWLVVSPTRSSP